MSHFCTNSSSFWHFSIVRHKELILLKGEIKDGFKGAHMGTPVPVRYLSGSAKYDITYIFLHGSHFHDWQNSMIFPGFLQVFPVNFQVFVIIFNVTS